MPIASTATAFYNQTKHKPHRKRRDFTALPSLHAIALNCQKDILISILDGRLAIAWNLLDPDLIPQLETFESVEEMLEDHRERMEIDRVLNSILDKDSE